MLGIPLWLAKQDHQNQPIIGGSWIISFNLSNSLIPKTFPLRNMKCPISRVQRIICIHGQFCFISIINGILSSTLLSVVCLSSYWVHRHSHRIVNLQLCFPAKCIAHVRDEALSVRFCNFIAWPPERHSLLSIGKQYISPNPQCQAHSNVLRPLVWDTETLTSQYWQTIH